MSARNQVFLSQILQQWTRTAPSARIIRPVFRESCYVNVTSSVLFLFAPLYNLLQTTGHLWISQRTWTEAGTDCPV